MYFRHIIATYGEEDTLLDRVFPYSLVRDAFMWFQHLAPPSVPPFDYLTMEFVQNHSIQIQDHREADNLFEIVGSLKEFFTQYVERFEAALLQIPNLE